ncbi:MAG: class E sortase [Dermatophilaceae bacterium]|nr:class E sortase [Dermatophilaceae bacterium]
MRGLRRGVRVFREVPITLGLLLFLFVAWHLWWTDVTANRAQSGTTQALEKGFGPAGLPARRAGGPVATLTKVPSGQAFAVVRIPRFGADYARPVLEATDRDTLIKGMGHYSGTAFPGQSGNFALAGHRTTYGRPLHDIDLLQKGDIIVVETKASYIVYAVERHVIVTPDKVEVIVPVPQRPGAKLVQAWLTMTACHPKFRAQCRHIVFARRVKNIPRASGLPSSFMVVPTRAVR